MTGHSCVGIQRIGIDLKVPEGSTELAFHCSRIKRIENLRELTGLKKLSIVSNLIEKIENLDANTQLECLDLYQNSITAIENIGHLTNLRVLDLSFNEVERIEHVDRLVNLRELYLTSNRIAKVENLKTLTQLQLLELGSNRVREYGDVEFLTELTSLWMGRNKLKHMRLPRLPKLTKCSLQNNRIADWHEDIAKNCPALKELYLSFNGLQEIPAFINKMESLTILDLGNNSIAKIRVEDNNNTIEELWLNDNAIEDDADVEPLRRFTKLRVLYLERNPIQAKLGPGYRNRILAMLPQITQLDALAVVNRVT